MNAKQKLLSAAMLAGAVLFVCGCAAEEEKSTSTDEPATTQSTDGEDGG